MNFASTLAANQRFNLARGGRSRMRRSPEALLSYVLDALRAGAARRVGDARSCSSYLRGDRRLDRQRRAAAGEGRRAWCICGRHAGVPVRMRVTRRQFVKGGVAAFTVTFAAPEFLSRSGARAGRARPQSGRALSERRQRRAEHAGSVQRSVLLQPPADACRAGRRTCCRSAPTRRGSRSACIRG